MPEHHADSTPQAQMIQMVNAHWISRLISIAAHLKLAEHLTAGPMTAQELASLTKTHTRSLYRVMRTLASVGVFSEDDSHRFSLTPLGATLRPDVPGTMLPAVLSLGLGGWFSHALENLLYSVQTGHTAFEKTYGMPVFNWLAIHPEEASRFSQTMVAFHGAEPAAVSAAYDFSGFKTIVDVGGATGNLLTTVLAGHPGPEGILFDLPHVVRDASAFIAARGLTERIHIEGGSFFESVPAHADAYLVSHIIHDWSEEQCLAILSNIRAAMKPDGRVLIVEMVLPPGDTPHPGKMTDIIMLAFPGGEERTEKEYAVLLNKAGFRLTRVVPTESAVSIVEAVAA